jgi:porphobilinogen synthase
MDGYPLRSLENTLRYIRQLVAIGIQAVMIRMDSPGSYDSRAALLDKQAAVVRAIRDDFPSLTIIVDPFSIALNTDKTWGVLQDGKLNYMLTLELFSSATRVFAGAGASYVLTLGRFEREVDVAKRTLGRLKSRTKVSSFSTNTETTNAYVYSDHGAYALTRQKILVSNYQEMFFRALVDIFEGSELVVVKPAENLHVLEKLKTLHLHPSLLVAFLESERVKKMADTSEYLRKVHATMLVDQATFLEKMQQANLAAYTVSGTYFQDIQTLKRKGSYFLTSLLYERFSNIASVLNETNGDGLIIDRNAYWFFAHSDK